MEKHGQLDFMMNDIVYRVRYGGTGIKDTLKTYITAAGLIGSIVGASAGGYVTNETIECLASDIPNTVRYGVDGLAAILCAKGGLKLGANIGSNLAVRKIKSRLESD